METWNFVGWQFLMTFVAVLAIAIFMFMRVRRSQQRRGEEPGKISVPKPPQR